MKKKKKNTFFVFTSTSGGEFMGLQPIYPLKNISGYAPDVYEHIIPSEAYKKCVPRGENSSRPLLVFLGRLNKIIV